MQNAFRYIAPFVFTPMECNKLTGNVLKRSALIMIVCVTFKGNNYMSDGMLIKTISKVLIIG